MIDAIRPVYSSSHGGSNKNGTTNSTFTHRLKGGVSCFISKKALRKENDWGSLLFVSGCAGAISMITDTLLNASELSKTNFTAVKNITRNAGVWAIIGGACFAIFKGIENMITKYHC